MKKIGVILIGIIVFATSHADSSSIVLAHRPGQPQVITVNGIPPVPYLDDFALADSAFPLPDEIATQSATVRTPVRFSIRRELIPLAVEAVKDLTFSWDFGDGSPSVMGDTVEHTYRTMGSYVISMNVHSQTGIYPMETVLLHVVPNSQYKLPSAKISGNGKAPEFETLSLDFSKAVEYRADESLAGSGEVQEIRWSFAKDSLKTGSQVTYSYPSEKKYGFVILEVKNTDGFLAHSFTYAVDQKSTNSPPVETRPSRMNSLLLWIGGIGMLLAGFFVCWTFFGRPTKA